MAAVIRDLDQRDEAPGTLAGGQDPWSAAFATSPLGMALVDLERRFIAANRCFAALLGRSTEEMVGVRVLDVTHPDDLWMTETTANRLNAGGVVDREQRFLRPDGTAVWVRTVTSLVVDAEGRPLHYFTQCQDRTARRRTVAELAGRAHHLGAILSTAPIHLLACDSSGLITRVEGRHGSEGTGENIADVFAEAPEMLDALRRGLAGETVESVVHLGDRRFRAHVRPQLDATGTVVGATSIATDITDPVQAEERATARDAFSRAILDSLPSPTVVLDQAGTVSACNRAWHELAIESAGDPTPLLPGSDHVSACVMLCAVLESGLALRAGILDVLGSRRRRFQLDYLGARGLWWSAQVSPLVDGRGAVISHVDITAHKRNEQESSFQALHDALTGLPNRVLLADRAAMALARAPRRSTICAILFVDIDRFKVVNDSLGHRVGDMVINEVAARIVAVVRPEDTVARFGGDEFCILAEDLRSAAEAMDIGWRAIRAIEEPLIVGERQLYVSASIGVALGDRPGTTVDGIIRDADAAMYRAKVLGRARTVIFDEQMRRDAIERLEVENGLRLALERGELVLQYQPIVELDGGAIAGVEALIRWRRPGEGLVLPQAFIPVAEETGLIAQLTQWVVPEACRQVRLWRLREGLETLRVSINVSARDLLRPGFSTWIAECLHQARIPGSALILEITESALINDFETAAQVLGEIKAFGVGIGVDDFGTGYSSLAYLQRLPIDVVKIHRTFVAGLDHDTGESAALVTALVQMGAALSLDVVAEGVETSDQAAALRRLGCGLGQGFLLGEPVDATAFDGVLQNHVAGTTPGA